MAQGSFAAVARAGVLPLLQRGKLPGSRKGIYLPPMRLGSHPLREPTTDLASHFSNKSMPTLTAELNHEGANGLHTLALQLRTQDHTRVVLVIDQFGELFMHTNDEQERQHFISLLLIVCAPQEGPLLVILTLRSIGLHRRVHNRRKF